MFDPSLGRWVTLDPVDYGSGDVDLYRAFSNNPINRSDASGTLSVKMIAGSPSKNVKCGDVASVAWDFELSKPAEKKGWLVQHVKVYFEEHKCPSNLCKINPKRL